LLTQKRDGNGTFPKGNAKTMKKPILISFVIAVSIISLGVFKMIDNSSSTAQKKFVNQWEYAAIVNTNIPFESENQAVINGAVNICFIQMNGCQNEEIKAELVFNKYIQEFRLENSNRARSLAYRQAKDLAFSKAVAKLGLEGWEMVSQAPFEFDSYIPTSQGNYTVQEGNKDIKPNIFFKRLKP
jgi:hypothetical protein